MRLPALAALTLLACALPLQAAAEIILPAVDVDRALAADAAKKGPQPYRFAVPVPLALTPAGAGEWSRTPEGLARWRLAVRSAGAASLNFGFTRYALPEGAALTIASADGRDRHGPYDAAHNAQGQLWTPVVRGEAAVIELTVPEAQKNAVALTLGVANHGFRGFGAKDEVRAKSGSCNIDVACGDGDAWRNEIRSVARYTIGGALVCSGQLVNNSRQDFTPYFLTANHCVPTAGLAPSTVYYWNYQTSRCGGTPDGSLAETQTGALFLAGSGDAATIASDFTLLQLLTRPSAAFKVYYAGWDRRNVAPRGVTGMHHPAGDEKRISMDFDQTFITAYSEEPDSPLSIATPTHLMVQRWDRGVTEGGSSGSGIWNNERRLVGQLSGGGSSCEAPDAPDWYGRMFSNFSNVGTPATSLSFWLDPNGNAMTVDGADPATSPTPPATGGGTGGGTGSGSSGGSSGGSGGGGAAGLWLLGPMMGWGLLRRRVVARC